MNTAAPVSSLGDAVRFGGWRASTAGIFLVALLLAWIARVAPEWWNNPDLSHGIFTPILFIVLLRESRARGVPRFFSSSLGTCGAISLCLAAALALLVIGCLYAVALDWTHALVIFTLGGAVGFALLAALVGAASAQVRLVPWNWAALAAVALWWLSVPLPPGTYARLTLQLQLWVTDGVLNSLHLLGIPATKNGNVIDLARTSVGVEEACSGVRSLLSCIYAGVFFSATFVQRLGSRVLLLTLAAPLAIGMNFVRSLVLTLLANRGVSIAGTWHDTTGFAILALTAAMLGGLALLLGKYEKTLRPAPALPRHESGRSKIPYSLLAAGYGAALAGVVFFTVMTRPVEVRATVPDLAGILPSRASGWAFVADDNLYPYTGVLQTNHLAQRTYWRRDDSGVKQLTIYLAYWPAGAVPVSHVASHTPDICWPGAGWRLQSNSPARERLALDSSRDLNPAEFRHFTSESGTQYVWFWHLYGNRVIESPDALSPRELLATVLRFGIRSRGEQLFVRVSSNRPWPELKDDPLVRTVFGRLAEFGI
jgi:exosortase